MSQARSLRRQKNRGGGKFAAFPAQCQRHGSYIALSLPAKALLHELNQQENGRNNGDLCAAWGSIKRCGIGSRNTVKRACDELERTGWIVQTRQGGRNSPNLYALTFKEIEDCGGKHDVPGLVGRRLDFWKQGRNPMPSARLATPAKQAA